MKKSKFPPGWDKKRVERVLSHYEYQSEEEAVAEDETAFETPGHTIMRVSSNCSRTHCKTRRYTINFLWLSLNFLIALVCRCLPAVGVARPPSCFSYPAL